MKPQHIIVSLLFVALAGCQTNSKKTNNNYELIKDDDGILVEKFDSTIVDENKYNFNNKIYKVGNSFQYKFEHKTSNNEPKYFSVNAGQNSWEFVPFESTDSTIVKSAGIKVASGNPMAKYVPDYNQTVLFYKIGSSNSFSMSGAIENEGNVWIHPPRDHYFRILELNPFPYIKAPYEIGTKWTWSLEIGDQWADDRWKLWTGSIKNEYQYEITNQKILKTELGDLEVYIIESKAKSRIGETNLVAFFNPTYGFVKLNYTNIDRSKTNLELTEHKESKDGR